MCVYQFSRRDRDPEASLNAGRCRPIEEVALGGTASSRGDEADRYGDSARLEQVLNAFRAGGFASALDDLGRRLVHSQPRASVGPTSSSWIAS